MQPILRLLVLSFVVVFAAACSPTRAADWPGFRGPAGDGVSTDTGVPVKWSDTQNLKWKLDLPGAGYSSPIVVGDRVYVTCYSDADPIENMKRHLVCVDRNTGKTAWAKEFPGKPSEQFVPRFAGRPGFASHTPVCDGERLYVLFGNSGVHAFDLQGELLWQKDVGEENAATFGSAASPILYKDTVIVTAAAESESIRAFDRKTGKEEWKLEAGSLNRCYSTPIIAQAPDGRDELLVPVVGEMWSINPETGKLLWYAETRTDTAACPALVAHEGVVFSLGGRGGGRVAVRLGGKDDVTDSHTLWSHAGGSYVPSPILKGQHLYWVNDQGVLTCIDIKTGEQAGRARLGGQFYASITLVNDKLYAVSRFGGTHILSATPELSEIATNELNDESDFSASPAISNGQIFLRSDKALYCIQKAADPEC